jgi:hypothetical protein
MGYNLPNKTGISLIELRLTRAYISLLLVPTDEEGLRSVSLARYGKYDVRLVESALTPAIETTKLWVELYAHDVHARVDRCSVNDLDEAVAAAKYLISRAKTLNEESRPANGENGC